jgi:hypothetical protein
MVVSGYVLVCGGGGKVQRLVLRVILRDKAQRDEVVHVFV